MRIRSVLVFLAAVASVACDDTLGIQPWDTVPDTVSLYSASRADLLGQSSAFDFVNLAPVRVEASGAGGNWDVILTGGGASPLQLTPAGVFGGVTSKASIATITGTSFDALTDAPSDTMLYSKQPVTLTAGGVYAIRTRGVVCEISNSVHYAKVLVVSLDPALGVARLATVRNPYCDNRSFVSPK